MFFGASSFQEDEIYHGLVNIPLNSKHTALEIGNIFQQILRSIQGNHLANCRRTFVFYCA